MRSDERFSPLIGHVFSILKKHLDQGASISLPNSIVVKMSDLPMIAKQSFPLCMLRYADRVKDNVRIGHTGWLRYTGLLKDSGQGWQTFLDTGNDITRLWVDLLLKFKRRNTTFGMFTVLKATESNCNRIMLAEA